LKTLIISKIIIRNKTPIKSVCVCNFDFISLVSADGPGGPGGPWIPCYSFCSCSSPGPSEAVLVDLSCDNLALTAANSVGLI